MKTIAHFVALHCGIGRAIDIGCGEGFLVTELLKLGIDAYGIDVSDVVIEKASQRHQGRFQNVSVLNLPFDDCYFDTVVSINCLENLSLGDINTALSEIYRVVKRFVFLQVAATTQTSCRTAEPHEWWEQRCFDAGFRKHPTYYRLNDHEAVNSSRNNRFILLEKIPQFVKDKSLTNDALLDEHNLHVDMLRESSEYSNAYMHRYKWAASFIRQGDRVLEVSCGLGYGSYALAELTKAKQVIGIDDSDWKIAYAVENFSLNKLDFCCSYLLPYLSKIEKGYFDVVVSFGALDLVENTEALLKEFDRILSPGGRFIVCLANETRDTCSCGNQLTARNGACNLNKLMSQIKNLFIQETQITWILPQNTSEQSIADCCTSHSEWVLMVGMKNPVKNTLPYRESVYGYSSPPDHLLQFERDYNNPWLVRSMLEFHFRATDVRVLGNIAQQVLERENGPITADRGAALAVLGYQLLNNLQAKSIDVESFISHLKPYVLITSCSPHLFRFHVSLAFLGGELFQKIGRFDNALDFYNVVVHADLRTFSPTLGTKVIDAAYKAGMLEAGKRNIAEARRYWKTGIEKAYQFLSYPYVEFVGDIENPHEFPTIDAVEFLDSAVRCVKALRVTAKDSFVPMNRLYELANDNWKCMIRSRDEVISSQAHMLEERWSIMQSMEAMIRSRDEVISSQAHMLEERWSIMQSIKKFKTYVCHENKISPLANMTIEDNEYPFLDLAFSLYHFIQLLYDTVLSKGVTDIFFFAREGQLIKEMFDFYQSSKSGIICIRTHYLRVSRRSTCLLSLGPLNEERFEVLFRQYRNISILDFLKSLDLDEYISEFAVDLGVGEDSLSDSNEDLPSSNLFQNLLQLSSFRRIYETERVARSDAFEKYLSSFFQDDLPDSLHVVDVGWKGSIQDNLYNWFYRKRGKIVQVDGYYLGLIATGTMSDTNRKRGLLFSSIHKKTPGFHIFNENRSLFEVVLHADHGSARRYIIDDTSTPQVIEDRFDENEMITAKVRPVSEAILRFFKNIVATNLVAPVPYFELFQLISKKHSRMVFHPTEKEIDWIVSITHEENFGFFRKSMIGSKDGEWTILDRIGYTWRIIRQERPSALGFWPWLSIKNHALPGLCFIYVFIRAWQSLMISKENK